MMILNNLFGVILFISVWNQFCLSQTTINLPVQYDAALGYHDNYGTENNNYQAAVQNAAYCIPGASGGENKNRALIKFDLNQIPECAEIINAKLDLFALGPIGSLTGHTIGNNIAQLTRVIENWDINTVSWSNQPEYTNLNIVILPASTSPIQDYLNIDVTALIIDMFNQEDFGILFSQVIEEVNRVMIFYSNDATDVSKRPVLKVTYELCENPVDSTEIVINSLDIPNVFTPNGDGVNDYYSFSLSNHETVEMTILNRWGQTLFQSSSENPNWDGKFNDKLCSEGVYFVIFKVNFKNGEQKQGHSYFHLER